MPLPTITCPICGAKISHALSHQDFTCAFCHFEHCTPTGSRDQVIPDVINLSQLLNIKRVSTVYIENGQAMPEDGPALNFCSLAPDDRQVEAIWADRVLPFQENLNQFFQEKYHQLVPGGLLYLSTPVKGYFRNPAPLPGQINFFKAKNIMFLLEQHGFKMAWRQNRFASTLKIIARRC
ncbi:MAG: hypothetical protein COB54_02105 [Alphaproteobacteria bacterium]|nr:MAG: hypothetical protein COB54_02105 [Alphaproteobacteria bacterium]